MEMEAYYRANSSWINLFRMEPKGQGAARNVILERSKKDIVVFFDDDVILSPGIVTFLTNHFEDPSVGAVVGRIDDNNGGPPCCGARVNWYGKVTVNHYIKHVHKVESVMAGNVAWRKSALLEVGGFWDLTGNTVQMREETDMTLRLMKAGYQIICEPNAKLLHLAYKSGGARFQTDRMKWYEDYFFAEFTYFLRNFAKWKLPFFLFTLARPILACSFLYGKGRLSAICIPWRSLKRAWH
jgi:GT2 family glycosyltransferase